MISLALSDLMELTQCKHEQWDLPQVIQQLRKESIKHFTYVNRKSNHLSEMLLESNALFTKNGLKKLRKLGLMLFGRHYGKSLEISMTSKKLLISLNQLKGLIMGIQIC